MKNNNHYSMTKRKGATFHIFLFLFIILLSLSVSADTYNKLGGEDGDFHYDERGLWNSQLSSSDVTTVSKSIVDPKYAPLIADIDGDSKVEIVVRDGCQFKIYEPSTTSTGIVLDFEVAGAIQDCPQRVFSNFVLNNIDGDAYTEIIIASGDENIHIYQWDGISFTTQSKYACSDKSPRIIEEMSIGCRDDGKCIRIEPLKQVGGSGRSVTATIFEQSCYESDEFQTSGIHEFSCFTGDKNIYTGDVDDDSEDEFVVSFMTFTPTSTVEDYNIYTFSVNSSHNITNIDSITHLTDSNLAQCSPTPCYCNGTNLPSSYQPAQKYFSTSLPIEFNNNLGDGKEYVFAVMTDQEHFKQYAYSQAGSQLDEFPSIQEADGILLSNPFEALAFPDIERGQGWCTIGYDLTDETVDIHCATSSDYTSQLVDNLEYEFDISTLAVPYNISNEFEKINYLSHSIQTSTITTLGTDMDEIMNPYGVFFLDTDSIGCGAGGKCDAQLIYAMPIRDAVVIASEVDNSGLNDLFALSSTSLTYIDDGFQNTPGYISNYEVNPCLDSVWLVNETVQVKPKVVDDADGDTVASRVIMYYGEEDEMIEDEYNWIYDSILNESESDGVPDSANKKGFGFVGTVAYEQYNLIKASSSGNVDRFDLYINDVTGTPENQNLIYDFYMCPTLSNSLGTNPQVLCDGSPTLIGDDVHVSDVFGGGIGWREIYTDIPFYVSQGQKYMLYWTFVNGTLSGSHDYEFMRESSPTSNYVVRSDYDTVTGARVNTSISSLNQIRFYDITDGEVFESFDSGWTSYAPSGTQFVHSFEATRKTSSSTLRIMGRDSGRPEVEDVIDLTFAVGDNGVQFGSCTTVASRDNPYIEGVDGLPPGIVQGVNDTLVASGLTNLDESLNLGFGASALYLLMLVVIIVLVVINLPSDLQKNHLAVGLIMGIIGVAGLIIGLKIHLVGYGTIFIIFVVFAGLLAFLYRGLVFGGG